MEKSQVYWEKIYCQVDYAGPGETDWLNRYASLFAGSIEKPIIDLGCGMGADTLYLLGEGYDVISCDFSRGALEKLQAMDSRVRPKCFDMRDGLPFGDGEAHVVIADLSLHYFFREETCRILGEIERVLDENGYLICRLNSVNDIHFGAGVGKEVEKNYLNREGHFKRFFDRPSIEMFFRDWVITYCVEKVLYRFGQPKTAWEVAVRKGVDANLNLENGISLKRLRLSSDETVDGLVKVLSEEDVIRYLPFRKPPSAAGVHKLLDSILKPDSLVWLICREEEVIGLIDLVSLEIRSASLAYFLAKPYWNRGILSSALDSVTAYAFSETDLKRIIAPVVSRNKASAGLLEKKGFEIIESGKETVNFDGDDDGVMLYELLNPGGDEGQ